MASINKTKVIKTENTAEWQASKNLPAIVGETVWDVERAEKCRQEFFIVLEMRIANYRELAARKPAATEAANVLEQVLSAVSTKTDSDFWKEQVEFAHYTHETLREYHL